MSGRHPDDEKLERYVFHPESISDIDELEAHLRECSQCGEFVAEIRAFEENFASAETWQVDETLIGAKRPPDQLTKLIETLRIEDQVAAYLLENLVTSPAAFREAAIHEDQRYHTAGVVRHLVDASATAREDQPRHALSLADSAVVIAEQLSAPTYDPDLIANLRGSAWRERANALRYLGTYPDALMAVDHAENAFNKTRIADFDLARLAFIRGTILWKMEQFDEALPFARRSRGVFLKFGDVQRQVEAGFLEGGILFDTKQYRAALTLFLTLQEPVVSLDSPATRARLANNIAAAYQETDQPSLAAPFFLDAMTLYEHLGLEIEKLRTAWSLGLLAVRTPGATKDGVQRLRHVAAGFEAHGSLSDAALVSLDIAEQQVVAGEYGEVVELARHLTERFIAAGMLTSAIMALQYLRDAAAAGRITTADVGHVRTFFQRLGSEPELLFAPPPPGA